MTEPVTKLGIEEVQADPGLLRVAPDQEILNLHRRLHQQYGLARERGEATEYPWVNVHVWVVQEMRRRDLNHNINDDLDRETERLMKSEVPEWLARRLAEAKEAVLVPAYVSVVGSATREDRTPADLDVLVREDENVLTRGWRESVMLLVRKLLDPEKTGLKIHILANPQGPHLAHGQGYVPVFDLVLRPRAPELVTKTASAMPGWERWLAEAPGGRRIDLGPGEEGPPEGFEGLGRPFDLEETWPLEADSVAVLRANHVFEHLREPAHAMTEAWRVLMPGGLLIVTVPEASSPGAVAHPEHRSLWNAGSFLFWTRADLLQTIEHRPPEPFELLHLAVREENGLRYVDAVLRKPARAATKRGLVPIATFTPPKPAQRGRAHTDAFSPDEIWPWVEKHLEEGVVAEPKYNGFRAVVQSDGRRVSIRFEDSQRERYPQLAKADPRLEDLLQLPPFILDCDLGVVQGGRRWSRPRLMTLTAAEPQLPRDAQIIITAFDVLYWDGEEVMSRPFRERRALLEKIAPQLEEAGVQIPPQMAIRTKGDLEKAWRSPKFGLADRSEGLVLKALGWIYRPGPATDGMAKVKHALEVKAIVLEVKRTKTGGYNFRGGLLPGTMVDEFDNLVEFRGRHYVDLGYSFNADFAAQPGDIITAEVEEITWDMADRRLNWLGAKPLDVDRERSQPYTAAQVIDMARRARVLQEVPVTKAAGAGGKEGGARGHTEGRPQQVAPATESKHLRVEVQGPASRLNDPDYLRRVALSLLQGEEIIEEGWHQFEPQGVSGFLMLSTSHIAVHTWPEEGRAIWDIESCHVDADPAVWLRRLQAEFDVVVSKGGDEEGDEDIVEINADDLPRRGHFTVMGVLWPYMERILRFVPKRGVKRIVEAFCGAGELIWFARAQEHVLADIDPDIVRLHRICRDLKGEDYERLRRFKWIGDENYYNRLWDADPPRDDLEFYHRELYLRRFGKRGREARGFEPGADGVVFNWEPRVRAAQRRLQQNVRILRADFRTTLRHFDGPHTFFFLDPPWPSRESMRATPGHGGYYRHDCPPVEEIAAAMRRLRGKAMLVIEGKGDQLKPLREAGFYERKFAWRHPWAASGAGDIQPLTYVSIFTNYDPDSVSKRAESDDGSAKTLRQPLKSPGGKSRIAAKLVALIPPHETYVEPYAGGAALFWRKPPSRREVLNDINADIMSVYQFLQKAGDGELEQFARRDWLGRRELFDRLVESQPTNLADRAYRALYLSRFGRHGPHSRRGDFQQDRAGQRAAITFEGLKEFRERLRGVVLTVGDALDTIRRYDGPDTFFYIDPPYLGANAGYRHGPDPDHIAQLGALLRQLKGKALVSGNYETIKALGLPPSWTVKRIATHYSMDTTQLGKTRYELIAANYPIAKALEEDDGETRSEAALRNWEENWQEAMPLSGKAQPFILHAHWRGLTEDEAQLSMEDLLKTNNSLHFDLRLGTDRFNGWWGITLFAGTTEDNRDELRILRMMEDADERLESAPKQFGPRPWLEVGKEQPLVVPPGGVGATTKAWSKFFAVDWGRWRLGFARQHAVEIILDGKRLRGRFLWQYAPLEEGRERQWLFTRPEDQRPYAQTHRLEDVIKELADKGQRWLVWPKDPDDLSKGHRLIDVQEEAKRLRLYRILRSEDERRYTLGVVYPVREVDAHGDYTTPEELERAAWEYMRKSRKVGLMHRPGTEGAGEVVESYIYRGPPWEINGQVVEPGDWLMGVIWREDVWALIKEGRIAGFSLQGWARRNGR